MKRAFTLIELVVAIGILAMVLSFSGVIFKVAADSYRVTDANAEIMQKMRAICEQLDADFRGLRKDGQIFVIWSAVPVYLPGYLPDADADYYANDPDQHVRFDRIMFFADGDFQPSNPANPPVRGNLARISYMLASVPGALPGEEIAAPNQPHERRMLARTQHILTADASVGDCIFTNDEGDFIDPAALTDNELRQWHREREHDRISLEQWMNIPLLKKVGQDYEPDLLAYALTFITQTAVVPELKDKIGGALIENESLHTLLCEGVGEF
ncbi:MAG: type II secretion system protein, partial [Planctomycetota bacterium]